MSETIIKQYKLDLFDERRATGYFDMPVIKKQDVDVKPDEIIGFNYAKSTPKEKRGELGVHFFLDDSQFERVWNQPERYMKLLKDFKFVIASDFSLYWDMPVAIQAYNVYRNRLLSQYWQDNGITVIPELNWSFDDSFDYCMDGLPEGGTFAFSAIGCSMGNFRKQWLKEGLDTAIEIMKPKKILYFGSKIDYDFGDIEVVYVENERLKKLRESKNNKEPKAPKGRVD